MGLLCMLRHRLYRTQRRRGASRVRQRAKARPSQRPQHQTGKAWRRHVRLVCDVDMEDPAEIAVLTSEFVSSMWRTNPALDNLPLEVSHILREIEIKDGKVQGTCLSHPDTLARIASKQAQMRELYTATEAAGTSSSTAETNKAKLEKLASRIAADYVRVEEWSSQKRTLAHGLWRKVHGHYDRALHDIKQIHPDVVASVASTVPKAPEVVPPSALAMALADAGIGESDDGAEAKGKRKRAVSSVHANGVSRQSPAVYGRHDRAASQSHFSRQTPLGDDDGVTSKDRSAAVFDGEEERDENLYCFCQRGSFGEMIGCDSDDCKYEWFHIGCVGVSKPLPQTWLCSDCLAKNKRRRRG